LPEKQEYWLFGTTDKNCWNGPGEGFNCYKSSDLKNWEGPFPAFRPSKDFWGEENFWAPEAYLFNGRFYIFASFKAKNVCRGAQILTSEESQGPYVPLTEKPVTPPDWECLDGTLCIDEEPTRIFCERQYASEFAKELAPGLAGASPGQALFHRDDDLFSYYE